STGRALGVEEPPAHFIGQGKGPVIALCTTTNFVWEPGIQKPTRQEEPEVEDAPRPLPLHLLPDARPIHIRRRPNHLRHIAHGVEGGPGVSRSVGAEVEEGVFCGERTGSAPPEFDGYAPFPDPVYVEL